MLRHNLLLIYRNFKRYKSSFFINLIGLSTGLACTFLIYLWVKDELLFDKFHENDGQLFQVMENWKQANGIWTSTATSGPLAESIIKEMPEIEKIAITGDPVNDVTLSVGENFVRANGRYASKDYFNVFSYPLIEGDQDQILSDKSSIVISQALAKKLFNTTEKVIGKVIEFERSKQFLVSGIFKDVPANSSEQFDFVLPYALYEDMYPSVLEWDNTASYVYVILRQGTNIDDFNKKISDYVKVKTNGQITHRTPFLKRYSERYLYGKFEDGVQVGGRIEYVKLFSIIAVIILVIACINFMNLSTAKATRKLKEVGIKKTVGADRKALVFQYLGESMVMSLLSLITAILLVLIVLPNFNEITGKHLAVSLDAPLIAAGLGITIFTGIVSGSYPALYLSGFNPVNILKGKIRTSAGELWARKGLVVFQFVLSVVLIVCVLVVYKQIGFVQTKNLGYNKDNIIWFKREGKLIGGEHLDAFLSKVKDIPGIVKASTIRHNLTGHVWGSDGLSWEGKNPEDKTEFEIVTVYYDMLEALGIKMKDGRSFSRDFTEEKSKVIFNETAIKLMELKDPVGKTVNFWGMNMPIIGVAKDFHFESLHENIKPLVFIFWPDRTDRFMAKIEAGKEQEVIEALRAVYSEFNPGFSLDYKFLDQDYQTQYMAEQRISILSRYFAGLAIIITCLGLFGLAGFMAERRLKEVGIRKVLGCSEVGIVYLLSSNFTKMVILSVIIALPISYFLAKSWLSNFAFKIDLEWWYFLSAGAVALMIAWLTIGFQVIKTSFVNPTKCLRAD